MSKNKETISIAPLQEKIDNLAFRANMTDLLSEAEQLFTILDAHSVLIHKLEQYFNEATLFFPFSYKIKQGKESILSQQDGYATRVDWFLSWDKNEESKKYRLFLISQEQELSCLDNDGHFYFTETPKVTIIDKKPLIETSLTTRMQYFEYINPFIIAFKNYLTECRIAIESGTNPFLWYPFKP